MSHLNDFMLEVGDIVTTPGGIGVIVEFVDPAEAPHICGLVGVRHGNKIGYYSALSVDVVEGGWVE